MTAKIDSIDCLLYQWKQVKIVFQKMSNNDDDKTNVKNTKMFKNLINKLTSYSKKAKNLVFLLDCFSIQTASSFRQCLH